MKSSQDGYSGISVMSRCTRCKSDMGADFKFCVNCGQSRKGVSPARPIEKSKIIKSASSNMHCKSKIDKSVTDSKVSPEVVDLPSHFLAALNKKLAEPVITKSGLTKRLEQQIQAQLLEVANAEGVELAAKFKLSESVAMDAHYTQSIATNGPNTVTPTYSKTALEEKSGSLRFHPTNSKLTKKKISSQSAESLTRQKGKGRKIGNNFNGNSNIHQKVTYLSEVEPVSKHYELYMSRLKQLEGLRAALLEPPPLPSDQLRERDEQHYDRSISDFYHRITSSSDYLLMDESAFNTLPAERNKSTYEGTSYSSRGNSQSHTALGDAALTSEWPPTTSVANTASTTSAAPTRSHSEFPGSGSGSVAEDGVREEGGDSVVGSVRTIEGMAFTWGPIFNPQASESISFMSSSSLAPATRGTNSSPYGVTRLNASELLGGAASSTTLHPSCTPPRPNVSPNVSPSASPSVSSPVGSRRESLSNLADELRKHTLTASGSKEQHDSFSLANESEPIVMFWGNVLQAEQQLEESRMLSRVPSSARLSPGTSFRSRMNSMDSSADDGSLGSQSVQDAAEVELPAWIELLAAETAGIREEFNCEDANIMRNVGARLSQLDAANIHLMSKRALMVQYSMEGVVQEYWEKMRRMKAEMRIQEGSITRSDPSQVELWRKNEDSGDDQDGEGEGGDGSVENGHSEESKLEVEALGTHSRKKSSHFGSIVLGGLEEMEEYRAEDEEQGVVLREGCSPAKLLNENHESDDVETAPGAGVSVHKLNKSTFTMDRGQIFEVIEEQESSLAEVREESLREDEALMQELLLSLLKAHEERFHQPTSTSESDFSPSAVLLSSGASSSGVSGPPSDTVKAESNTVPAEHRISERLQQQELQESEDREHRDVASSADDIALQRWLVAVTAFDAERARKQTLRTLHMEEMEDDLAGSGDDDDEVTDGEIKSASKRDGKTLKDDNSMETQENDETVLASATIDVPDNNSLTRIKSMYRQSCSKMLALLTGLDVDFTVDQTEHPEFRTESRSKVLLARKVLKASTAVDHKAALEYRVFLDHCALRRTAIAMKLSEAMLRASELEKSYRDRYTAATLEFKNSPDAILAESSSNANAKHVTASKHMRAIQKSAELDIARQGKVVKGLQADEAKLILNIRQEQFVLSEVLTLWQARHSRILSKFSTAYKRFSGLLDSYRLN